MGVRIEGVSDVLRMYDNAPKEMINHVKKAMRSACNVEKRNLKRSIPPNARSLVKSKVKGSSSGNVTARFGMFGTTRMENDDEAMRWFHYYWKNYGTLQGRDPSHHFDNPIRHAGTQAGKNRRNNVGQVHENFYEVAVSGYETRFVDNFRKAMKEQGYEIE